MPDATTFALFAAACLAFLVIPGPSVFYIVTRSLVQGRRAGVTSMLGVQAGGFVHVVAAAFGVSALIASSAAAFTVVKYAGAAYLVFLGVRKLLLRDHGAEAEPEPRGPASTAHLFWHGVVVNVLNPKTALFFLAFLPQFVDPSGAIAPQMLVLGTMLICLGVISDGTYALVAAGAGNRLRRATAARRRLERVSGGVFVGLGLVAALAGEPARTHG
jgi:threonine/homoserine/homoserine lactone efflux protein